MGWLIFFAAIVVIAIVCVIISVMEHKRVLEAELSERKRAFLEEWFTEDEISKLAE